MAPPTPACSAASRSRGRALSTITLPHQRRCYSISQDRIRPARPDVLSSLLLEARFAMRLVSRDLPLIPLLLPVAAIGLFPLVMLPLLGFLGFVVLGVLLGFAAIMAELEEPQAHVHSVISHGPM